MSDQANWMEINDKHLAATIAWIRLRWSVSPSLVSKMQNRNPEKSGLWFEHSKLRAQGAKNQNKPAIDSETIELARRK